MSMFLLITANVGSIFEDPNGLLPLWVAEFLRTVDSLRPKFIALHCQEFGGKNYDTSMSYVDEFVRALLSSKELLEYENIRVFLDEDFSSSDKFTALGSLYFIHKSLEACIWNFDVQSFTPVLGKEVHSGNIESVPIKYKIKFPQDFFPQFKWSRKGFMKTRWLINGVAFDMINIHLFHDESNFVSISNCPSVYALNRRKALQYTLDLNHNDSFNDLPLFIFGDFNFRLDSNQVIKKLTNNAKSSRIQSPNGDPMKLIYHNNVNEDVILALERKYFFYSDIGFFNNQHNVPWLLEQDKESHHFKSIITELKIEFPPSYPFNEDRTSCFRYMNTRCPSWCDRVFMNRFARQLFDQKNFKAKYEMMGYNVPMGDHKPVYLAFQFTPSREEFPNNVEVNQVNICPMHAMMNGGGQSPPHTSHLVHGFSRLKINSLGNPKDSRRRQSSDGIGNGGSGQSSTIRKYIYYQPLATQLDNRTSSNTVVSVYRETTV